MLDEDILRRFRSTPLVPVVSGDPVERPLGRWLRSGGSDPDTVLVGVLRTEYRGRTQREILRRAD